MELTQDFIDALFGSDANLQLADPSLVQYYHDLANRSIWIDSEINAST